MNKILTCAQMYKADSDTIAGGTPSRCLMERAADECVRVLLEKLNASGIPREGMRIAVIAGTGNNGGDGVAIARFLHRDGICAELYTVGNPAHRSAECKVQITEAEHEGVRLTDSLPNVPTATERGYDAIVDALFGIGLSREITADSSAYKAISFMNETNAPVLSVDIPSGINGDTGAVMGIAVKATWTVAISNPKRGEILLPGNAYVGELTVCDIGIHSDVGEEDCELLLTDEDFSHLAPRCEDGNKGTFGRLLCVVGSLGMSGAAYLSSKAAYRVGAGLVRILTAEENRTVLQTMLPEAIITTYSSTAPDTETVKSCVAWATAIVVGCGLGTTEPAKTVLQTVLENTTVPTVMDADALNLIASGVPYPKHDIPIVITPHPAEFSRLLGISVGELLPNLSEHARAYAKEHHITVVAKDARSAVSDENGIRCVRIASGNSALAKGGSGDVLAGVIGGLLASGTEPFWSAVLGAQVHGLAGKRRSQEYGVRGVLASEVADACALVLRDMTGS